MKIKVCSLCGNEYEYHGRGSGDHTKYCSDECFSKAMAASNLKSWYKNEREKQKAKYNGDEKRAEWLRRSIPEGFTYLNDWEPGKSQASFRCNKHNVVVTRNLDAIMKNRFGSVRCPECRREWEQEYQKRRGKRICGPRKYGDWTTWKAVLEEQKAKRKREAEENIPIITCQICGKEFRANDNRRKTCGGECARIYANTKIDRRVRPGCLVDKNITLKRLYKRDSGICHLCGGLCDWNDKRFTENGVMICGDKYPTKDHIIPLAKNGLHSWENVKLAHWRCNLEKSDGVYPDLHPDGRRVKTYAIPKRCTEQYTLDGLLIASYNSTAEAERRTGIKQRGIQNCARGECKTYRGFVWRYV